MKNAKNTLLLLLTCTLAACAAHDSSTPGAAAAAPGTSSTDQLKAAADPENDADILADAGEAALGIQTLSEAQEKFRASLKANPTNARADIWNAYINALLEMKGFVSRIRPVFESQPDGAVRYQRIVKDLMNVREPDVRRFFLQGPADMRSTREIQEWMDRFTMRLDDLRTAISRHKTNEVRLVIPREFLGQLINFIDPLGESHCNSISYGPIEDGSRTCNSERIPILLNRADFEVLEASVSYYETVVGVLNAYVIDPSSVAKIQDATGDTSSYVELINASRKLRKSNLIPLAGLSLRDIAASAKYEIENARELCPKGHVGYKSRPGHFFSIGLCFTDAPVDTMARFTRVIDQLLNHQPLTIFTEKQDSIVDIDVDKFIAQPLQDLSVVGPIKAPYCRTPTLNMTPLTTYTPRGSLLELFKTFGSCPL